MKISQDGYLDIDAFLEDLRGSLGGPNLNPDKDLEEWLDNPINEDVAVTDENDERNSDWMYKTNIFKASKGGIDI